MRTSLDILREIQDEEQEKMGNFLPQLAENEDPRLASIRLKLGMRKPTQKVLLSQIFGTPEKGDENAISQYFRIKREQT